jgi:hypothetical protein
MVKGMAADMGVEADGLFTVTFAVPTALTSAAVIWAMS